MTSVIIILVVFASGFVGFAVGFYLGFRIREISTRFEETMNDREL